jgi:hypothetical protein
MPQFLRVRPIGARRESRCRDVGWPAAPPRSSGSGACFVAFMSFRSCPVLLVERETAPAARMRTALPRGGSTENGFDEAGDPGPVAGANRQNSGKLNAPSLHRHGAPERHFDCTDGRRLRRVSEPARYGRRWPPAERPSVKPIAVSHTMVSSPDAALRSARGLRLGNPAHPHPARPVSATGWRPARQSGRRVTAAIDSSSGGCPQLNRVAAPSHVQ